MIFAEKPDPLNRRPSLHKRVFDTIMDFGDKKQAVEKDPTDRVARKALADLAGFAGGLLQILQNRSDSERKANEAQIEGLHNILRFWEDWRKQHGGVDS